MTTDCALCRFEHTPPGRRERPMTALAVDVTHTRALLRSLTSRGQSRLGGASVVCDVGSLFQALGMRGRMCFTIRALDAGVFDTLVRVGR